MLKVNDKVKVHMYDTYNREIKTRNYGTVFTVKEVNGKLGIQRNHQLHVMVKYLHRLKHFHIQ